MALLFSPNFNIDVPRHELKSILDKIEWVWNNREVVMHQPLKSNLSGYYKKKVSANCRVIYSLDNDSDDMIVHLMGQRKTIYKEAKKRLS